MPRPSRDRVGAVPGLDGTAAVLDELGSLLWRERGLLERLQYRLISQAALVERASWRWLPTSGLEVRDAIALLQSCELARATVTEEVAARVGLPGDVTLRALALAVPEPWPTILDDHRVALRRLARDARERAARTALRMPAACDRESEAGTVVDRLAAGFAAADVVQASRVVLPVSLTDFLS